MGLSVLITTEEQRRDIAMQLLPYASLEDNGGVTGTFRKTESLGSEVVKYNPKDDFFRNMATSKWGDLLDLFCIVRDVQRGEGGAMFCELYDLDFDFLRGKEGVMKFMNFVPSEANRSLWPHFKYLNFIGQEHAEWLRRDYGWSENVLTELGITIYEAEGVVRAAIPVRDRYGKLIRLDAVNNTHNPKLIRLGSPEDEARFFPEVPTRELMNASRPILITTGYLNTLSALSQDIDASGLFDWGQGEFPSHLMQKLKGLEVVLSLPPADSELANILAEVLLPIAKEVHFVKWPEECRGLAHYFNGLGGTVDSLGDITILFRAGAPMPLTRALEKPQEYPVDALPPVIRNAVIDVSSAMQCSPALAAQSFLAVSALTVQGYLNVEIDGRKSPASCFFVTIAESGERKSSVDRLAMAPIVKLESELRAQAKLEMAEYQMKMAIRKKREADALKTSHPELALRKLGQPPEHPLDGSLTCEEPTYEGLIVKMVHGQPSIGIFSDEGGRFLGGAAMTKENQQKSAAGISTLWDGRPVSRTRVADGSFVLEGRRLSMHLMLQPAIADQLLGNGLLISQGIMSRILVAYPETNIGNRQYSRINLNDSAALKRFNEAVADIHACELPLKPGTTNELIPPSMTLSPEAMECWIEFHNHVESEMLEGRQYSNITGFAAKAAEHAARLACVITAMDDLSLGAIPLRWMESAIRIVEYHLSETTRLLNSSKESQDLKLAEKCIAWLRANFPTFSLVELYQKGPNPVRSQMMAKKIVQILADHGWVVPIEGGAVIDCNKRKIAWRVVE